MKLGSRSFINVVLILLILSSRMAFAADSALDDVQLAIERQASEIRKLIAGEKIENRSLDLGFDDLASLRIQSGNRNIVVALTIPLSNRSVTMQYIVKAGKLIRYLERYDYYVIDAKTGDFDRSRYSESLTRTYYIKGDKLIGKSIDRPKHISDPVMTAETILEFYNGINRLRAGEIEEAGLGDLLRGLQRKRVDK